MIIPILWMRKLRHREVSDLHRVAELVQAGTELQAAGLQSCHISTSQEMKVVHAVSLSALLMPSFSLMTALEGKQGLLA